MPNEWRTIKSLVHKIRLHGRRGEGVAESFSREKLRHAPQKEGGWKILCDLPPVWPRLVRPTNLMSKLNGKKTHTHTYSTAVVVLTCCIWTYFIPIVGVGKERHTIIIGLWWCKGGTRYSNYLEDYTGPVPADSRQWTLSVRNCMTRYTLNWPDGVWW